METIETPHNPLSVTPVDVTDDRGALPKRWVAALVQMRCEKAVSKKLDGLHIENYVPIQRELHQWSDRKKQVDRIVIPMVVFVRAEKADIRRLVAQPLIYKVLSYPGQQTPAFIPDHQIERLKFMLRHAESQVEMKEQVFKSGETVRIMRGPLKDLEGELCRVDEGKPMVAVRIDCLGYACVSIDKSDLMNITPTPKEKS